MPDKKFKFYFNTLFFTAFMPYLPAIFPFLPGQVLGFNLTGWAWISTLLITILYLPYTRRITFPVVHWLPWMLYLLGYIVYDFSFMGLQLTLQYILPLLVGWVVSGFVFTPEKLNWLLKQLRILMIAVLILALFYKLVFGWSPSMASTPMLLSIGAALTMAFYFYTRKFRYALAYFALFSMPFLNVTRMAIAAFLAIWVMHFANFNIKGKIMYGVLGLGLLILVFNSKGFQEKTFYEGKGEITDLSINYYESNIINSSGRSSWKMALESGLEKSPLWGNGPRSDAYALGAMIGMNYYEAHNDYMSVRHNYGWVGLILLLFGFAASFMSVYRLFRKNKNPQFFLIASSLLTLFIVFLLFMYSDNILKYTITFPNLFFAIMGMVASMGKNRFDQYQINTSTINNENISSYPPL